MLSDFIPPWGAFCRIMLPSRAALLARLCDDAERLIGVRSDCLLAAVLQREAQGPTGLGSGLALPHAQLCGVTAPKVLLATLSRPIDFGGIDGVPADVVLLLISPDAPGSMHLKALARLVRTLRTRGFVEALRGATSDAALMNLVGPHSPFPMGGTQRSDQDGDQGYGGIWVQ